MIAARQAVDERNLLKATARQSLPKPIRLIAEWRNLRKYENRIGPDLDWLMTKAGKKDLNKVIASAGRTNQRFNRFFGVE